MPSTYNTSSAKFIGQEVSLGSFAVLYPFGCLRLIQLGREPDRVLTIRRGLKSGPVIGQIIAHGSRYSFAILRGRSPLISTATYPTIGAALEDLADADAIIGNSRL